MAPPRIQSPARAPAVTSPGGNAVVKDGAFTGHTGAPGWLEHEIRYAEGTWNGGKRSGYPAPLRRWPLPEHGPPTPMSLWSGLRQRRLLAPIHFCLPTGVRHRAALPCRGFGPASRIRPPSFWWKRRGALAAIDRGVALGDRTLENFRANGPPSRWSTSQRPLRASRPKPPQLCAFSPADAGKTRRRDAAWRLRVRDTPRPWASLRTSSRWA